MFRTFTKNADGTGRLVCKIEDTSDREELEAVFPPAMPAGYRQRYEWTADRSAVALLSEPDPEYKPPETPPETAPRPLGYQQIPSREALLDQPIQELITRAAELGVGHNPRETKAVLVQKMLTAWAAHNKELEAKARPK